MDCYTLWGILGDGRKLFQVLAAPPEKHQRLLETARRLPEILMANGKSLRKLESPGTLFLCHRDLEVTSQVLFVICLPYDLGINPVQILYQYEIIVWTVNCKGLSPITSKNMSEHVRSRPSILKCDLLRRQRIGRAGECICLPPLNLLWHSDAAGPTET